MQTATLTTGQFAHAFTLINTFEVKAAHVGAAWHFGVADLHDIQPAGDFFPHGFAVIHCVTELINGGQFHGFTQLNVAAVRLFLTGHHAEQGRFTRAVRTDNADNRAFRYGEAEIVDQNAVAVGFTQIGDLNDFIAQTRSRWNKQFVGFVTFLVFGVVQLFKASQTRLALRLTAFRTLTYPLQLFLNGFTASRFLRGFLRQTLIFLLKPGGVVAFPRNTFTAVKLQDPARYVIKEVTVVGDRHHGTFEVVQEAFQPGDGFGVQVVSRFVEQQHVWLFQQQTAQRDAAAFTTGKFFDFGVPVRQTQRIGGAFQLHVQVMTVVRLDDLFKLALLRGKFIEVCVRFSVLRIHFVQTFQRADHFSHRFFHGLTHGVFRVQLRFLRQVTHFKTRLRARFPFDIGINTGHDAQQRGFTGTVQAQYADFCPREEAQRDVFQNMTFRRNHFADTMHGINELSHVGLRLFYRDVNIPLRG